MIKYCYSCKQKKDTSLFYKNKSTKDGFHVACKLCNDEYQRNRYRTDKIYRDKAKRTWIDKNLQKQYGLTLEKYYIKLKLQNNSCKICKTPAIEFTDRLPVDHNHSTNEVRGILCNRCNMAVGIFEDKKLKEAIEDYLFSYW